jgi:hypothetical protein
VYIGGGVLTRADRQRYKIPVYNPTTSQPLPDVKVEGNLALNFDNSAFHTLFPDAELAVVRIPKPPDRASPEEVAEHQARMRELAEQGIEIDGQRYDLIPPESSLKGNSPGPGEYVWDTTHLGFNAWSERRRVKFSYQYFRDGLLASG